MAFLQPATNNYFGLMPTQGVVSVNPYPVSSTEALPISIGDVCCLTSKNTVKTASSAQAAVTNVIGVAASPIAAGAGSTNQTFTNMVMIYDSPDQRYVVCDSSSGVVGSSGVGLSYFLTATGVIGSTGPHPTRQQSVMAIAGAVQASSAGVVKIIAMHPIENNIYSTGTTGAANVRKWVVNLAAHTFQPSRAVDLLTS